MCVVSTMRLSFLAFLALLASFLTVVVAADDDDSGLFSFLRVPMVVFGGGGSRPEGEYFGQWATREADGRKVPHGIGSFIDAATGRVEYAGRWFNGRSVGSACSSGGN